MNKFEVTILGSGSALPTLKKRPTSQLVQYSNKYFLIDCGEGTQVQVRKAKVSFLKISHIFISHLHGDHYFGLIGLISSMHLLGRVADLHVYGPKELNEIIHVQLRASYTQLRYKLVFHELVGKDSQKIYEDKNLEIHTIPLKHKILTNGFLIQEKPRPRKAKPEKLKFYEVPHYKIDGIKMGDDFETPSGEIIPNDTFTFPPEKERSYAFCSDTAYSDKIVPLIENSSLLYHEATFLEKENALAKKTYHSTAVQAGLIANKAKVKGLLIGHFSARYKEEDTTTFLNEARTEFENVEIAEEGKTYSVK